MVPDPDKVSGVSSGNVNPRTMVLAVKSCLQKHLSFFWDSFVATTLVPATTRVEPFCRDRCNFNLVASHGRYGRAKRLHPALCRQSSIAYLDSLRPFLDASDRQQATAMLSPIPHVNESEFRLAIRYAPGQGHRQFRICAARFELLVVRPPSTRFLRGMQYAPKCLRL